MMYRFFCFVILVSVFTLLSGAVPLFAIDNVRSMRCSSRIVGEGSDKYEVTNKCGEPTEIYDAAPGHEVWVYEFGATRLVHSVHFIGGKIYRIETGGR